MIKKGKKYDFETLYDWVKDKDPSIIGKTCETLSTLKIIALPPNEALPFVIGIIEALKKESGKLKWLSEEQWSDFRGDTLEKYLPKILKKREWIFSIKKYVTERILNSITVEKRRGIRQVPLYIESEDEDGNSEIIVNPALKDEIFFSDIEQKIQLNEIFEKANLTEQEMKIFYFKKGTKFTGKLIAKTLNVTTDIVKHDYKNAKDKLVKLVKAISH